MKNNIDYATKKKYALYALKWCNTYFGKCKRKKRELIFEINPRKN
jgi:hypothetical protein